MTTSLKHYWLRFVAIIAVVVAAYWQYAEPTDWQLPFAYYQLMNWVVVGAGLTTAYQAHKQGKEMLAWLFIAVAVVFNPIAPINLRADIWRMTDIVVALCFLFSLFLVPAEKKQG